MKPTPQHIIQAVLATFAVSEKELFGKRKHKNVANARKTAGYLLQTEAGMDNKAVARMFGQASYRWSSWARLACLDHGETDKTYAAKVADCILAAKALAVGYGRKAVAA